VHKLSRNERIALKSAAVLFVLFWVAVIVFRIVLMASDTRADGWFT
jgi:hypothetical protein